jgi:hypothetical protein
MVQSFVQISIASIQLEIAKSSIIILLVRWLVCGRWSPVQRSQMCGPCGLQIASTGLHAILQSQETV